MVQFFGNIWTEEIQIEELILSSEIHLSEVGRIGFLYVFSKVNYIICKS